MVRSGGYKPPRGEMTPSTTVINVIDASEKIDQAMDTIESMMQDGLIVTSDVDVIRLIHSPLREVSDANGPSS